MPNQWTGQAPSQKESAVRMRRWRANRQAAQKAAHKEFLAQRRAAKGLPPIKTSTQRAAESRKRKAAAFQEYLALRWWSPEISAVEAKSLLQEQHPELDGMAIEIAYGQLLGRARCEKLNVNRFVIADAHTDGIKLACERRAIFYELYRAAEGGTKLPDAGEILKREEATKSLLDTPRIASFNDDPAWQKNVVRNALDLAKTLVDVAWVYRAVCKPH